VHAQKITCELPDNTVGFGDPELLFQQEPGSQGRVTKCFRCGGHMRFVLGSMQELQYGNKLSDPFKNSWIRIISRIATKI